jgi:hypothetical protein
MVLNLTNTETSATVVVGDAVSYKTAGAFVAVPEGVYNLGTRVAGSSTNAISRSNITFNGGRVYTITARGTMGATGTPAPFLDNTTNR